MTEERLGLTKRPIGIVDFAALAVSTIAFSMVLALMLTGCGTTPVVSTGESSDAGTGTENSTPHDTRLDGCVLYEDFDISEGQDMWDDFVSKSSSGEPCTVRLAFYHSPPDKARYAPDAYTEALNNYQPYRFAEVSFDGISYWYTATDVGEPARREYSYLIKYAGTPRSKTVVYAAYELYVLVNDNTLTWEQLEASQLSSQSGAYIDHETVYYDLIYR
jgi:hypothetical protein